MKIITLIKQTYQNIIIAKKLLWFFFNLIAMLPPFKQFKYLAIKIAQIIKSLYPKLIKLIQENQTIEFIVKLQRQTVYIVLLVLTLAAYVYIKFYKLNKGKTIKNPKRHKQQKSKVTKNLEDIISEKSIILKKQQQNIYNYNDDENENENDNSCQEIRKHLHINMSKEDKLFLQILKQYQDIDHQAERRPQFYQVFYETEQINNKEVFDNSSTEVGGRKTISKNIPPIHKIKREQDFNKSF